MSQTASQRSSSQNSLSCCTPGCLFTNGFFQFWLIAACLSILTQNDLAILTGWFRGPSKRTNWIKKSSFTGLVTFECPLRGEKKPLLEKENLDSVLKSISTSSLACILNLNMWILKIKAPQVKIFEPLKSCISKWENRRRMNWPPPKKYPSPSQDNSFPPWN